MKSHINSLKAIADETRLRILIILFLGSFHVNEIVEILEMGQSRISRHLKILQDAELIFSRREGTLIYYYLNFDREKNFQTELIELLNKYKTQISFYEKDFVKVQEILDTRSQLTRSFFDKLNGEAQKIKEQVLDVSVYKETLLKMIPQKKEILVDFGCGIGRLFSDYKKRVKKIIGVDSSSNMLSLAKVYNKKISQLQFIQSNLEKLNLPNNFADVVVTSMVLHHVSSPYLAIQEAYRILKPKGTLCVIDLAKHNKEFMRNIYADLWLGFEKEVLFSWLEQARFKIQKISEISTEMDLKIIAIKTIKE